MRRTYDLMDLALCIIEPAIAALFAAPINTTGRRPAYTPATFSQPTPQPAPQPDPEPADDGWTSVGVDTPGGTGEPVPEDAAERSEAHQDAAQFRGPVEERAELDAREDDDRGFFDHLSGPEVCEMMRRHRVRVCDLQNKLLVSQARVQHVRKYGVTGAAAEVWREAITSGRAVCQTK